MKSTSPLNVSAGFPFKHNAYICKTLRENFHRPRLGSTMGFNCFSFLTDSHFWVLSQFPRCPWHRNYLVNIWFPQLDYIAVPSAKLFLLYLLFEKKKQKKKKNGELGNLDIVNTEWILCFPYRFRFPSHYWDQLSHPVSHIELRFTKHLIDFCFPVLGPRNLKNYQSI